MIFHDCNFIHHSDKIKKKKRISPRYWSSKFPYHTCLTFEQSPFDLLSVCLKYTGWTANSVDPDQTPRSAASDLGLHCLLWSVSSYN